MRSALLIVGFFSCLIGAELLIVDKIVLHQISGRSAKTTTDSDSTPDPEPRLIDLPDSAGYVLVTVGVVCLLYSFALRRHKERRGHSS